MITNVYIDLRSILSKILVGYFVAITGFQIKWFSHLYLTNRLLNIFYPPRGSYFTINYRSLSYYTKGLVFVSQSIVFSKFHQGPIKKIMNSIYFIDTECYITLSFMLFLTFINHSCISHY